MSDDNIKVNFTDEEASSEARVFEAIPTGEYLANITKIEKFPIKEYKPNGDKNKNFGQHYWKVELTVQEGKYAKSKLWSNVMLFSGAGYTLAQLMKATGHLDALKTGNIPPQEQLMGETVTVVVQKKLDQYQMGKLPSGADPIYKSEVNGFKPASAGKVSSGGSGSSILP